MFRVLGIALLAGAALSAQSSSFGLGVSLQDKGGKLYLPWQVRPDLRIEGTLGYEKERKEQSVPRLGPDGLFGGWEPSTQTREALSGSLGIFQLKPLSEGFQLYYGPRFSYERHSDVQSRFTRLETRERSLSAVLGAELFATRRFSLSGEVGVGYAKTSEGWRGVGLAEAGFPKDSRGWRTNTSSALVARYYFGR